MCIGTLDGCPSCVLPKTAAFGCNVATTSVIKQFSCSMRLMLLRSSALLLALTALTACSTPQTSSTASTSEAEAPAPTPEPITKLKAVALSDALPYSSQNEQEWEGLAH